MNADLPEFLLARVVEDEAAARAATGRRWGWWNLEGADQGWSGQGPDLVVEPGEWKSCEFYCTWADGDPEHRGEPKKPGHEHLHRERVIDSYGHDAWGLNIEPADAVYIARFDPARVLAECEAKRRIIAEVSLWFNDDDEPSYLGGYGEMYWFALVALAQPYRDHPDFDPNWSPVG